MRVVRLVNAAVDEATVPHLCPQRTRQGLTMRRPCPRTSPCSLWWTAEPDRGVYEQRIPKVQGDIATSRTSSPQRNSRPRDVRGPRIRPRNAGMLVVAELLRLAPFEGHPSRVRSNSFWDALCGSVRHVATMVYTGGGERVSETGAVPGADG
jgi:hypothetical protein